MKTYLPKYRVTLKSVGHNAKIGAYQMPYYSEPVEYCLNVEQSSIESVLKLIELEYKEPEVLSIIKL